MAVEVVTEVEINRAAFAAITASVMACPIRKSNGADLRRLKAVLER